MKDDNGALARKIDELREQSGMNCKELAEKACIKREVLWEALHYKRSRVIVRNLISIIRALDVDAETAKQLMDMAHIVMHKDKKIRHQRLPKAPKKEDLTMRPPRRKGRYDAILKAINDGESDGKILRDWPELTSDVLAVYHKIVDGKLCSKAKRGGMYDKGMATALENFRAIAFRTGSLRRLTLEITTG